MRTTDEWDSLVKQAAGTLAAAVQGEQCADGAHFVRLLKETRLLRALAPCEVGGLGATLSEELQLVRHVSRIDPDLGWLYLNLAGAAARLGAVCPPELAETIFAGEMPVIAMHADAAGGSYSQSGDRILISGKWRYATGIDNADWIVVLGRPDSSLPEFAGSDLACVLKPDQVKLFHDYRPIGLNYTSTHSYGVSVSVKRQEVWRYHHLRPIRGGSGFSLRRSPIKHLAFAIGIAEASLMDHAVDLSRAGGDRDLWISRDIAVRACAALAESMSKRLDEMCEHSPESASKLLDQLQGTARYAMLLAQKATVEMLNRYGTAMDAGSPLARRATAILTAIQHRTVRRGYDVYCRGG